MAFFINVVTQWRFGRDHLSACNHPTVKEDIKSEVLLCLILTTFSRLLAKQSYCYLSTRKLCKSPRYSSWNLSLFSEVAYSFGPEEFITELQVIGTFVRKQTSAARKVICPRESRLRAAEGEPDKIVYIKHDPVSTKSPSRVIKRGRVSNNTLFKIQIN